LLFGARYGSIDYSAVGRSPPTLPRSMLRWNSAIIGR